MKNTKIIAVILTVVYTFYISGCSIYSTATIDDYKQIKGKDLLIYSATTKSGKLIKFDKKGGKLDDSLDVIKGVTENKDTVTVAAENTSKLSVKEYNQFASTLVNILGVGALLIIVLMIASRPLGSMSLDFRK